MSKFSPLFRDGILFIALVLMINHVMIGDSTHTSAPKQSNSIHEPDEHDLQILRHITQLQEQVRAHMVAAQNVQEYEQLKAYYQELESIAQDYTHLSPGTAPLGPFSSLFLVFKQRGLRSRLREIEQSIIS